MSDLRVGSKEWYIDKLAAITASIMFGLVNAIMLRAFLTMLGYGDKRPFLKVLLRYWIFRILAQSFRK